MWPSALAGRPDLVDVVPGHRTVLVTWAGEQRPDGLDALAESALANAPAPEPGRSIEIPVVYDGVDLEEVARLVGVSAEEVVERHVAAEYVVAFIGFAPGFAYLIGGDERLDVPRLSRPRERVPAGTVAIAGPYSGVYPRESPGGWRLLGRTPARAVRPGTCCARTPHERRPGPLHPPVNEVEVVRAGLLTTVQDHGRPGFAHLGVPPSGAADRRALELGNRIVGNDPGAAALETTLLGPVLRFAERALVTVTGAEADATSSGRPLERGLAAEIPAGGLLELGRCRDGVRAYISVRGGFAVEATLGSRSHDLLTGLGPPPLRDGDVLARRARAGPGA